MRSSNVCFGSSIIAHSSPRISTPWDSSSAGSTWRGSLPSSSSPSDSASRRAGSIVTTATRWPAAAKPSASAAEAVVLPTPPEPATMQMRLPARRSAAPVMSRARGREVELRRELVGDPLEVRAAGVQRQPRRLLAGELGEALELRALAQRAAVAAAARARRRGARRARSSSRASRSSKRSGSSALAITRSSSRPMLARSEVRSSPVSVTASSSALATATTAVSSGSDSVASIFLPWRATGPLPAAAANVRGAVSTATPCPVAGASTTTRSYGSAPGVRRSSCASSHSLPTVSSSRMPGVAAASRPKTRLRASRSATGPPGSWSRRYSSSASCGSTEM